MKIAIIKSSFILKLSFLTGDVLYDSHTYRMSTKEVLQTNQDLGRNINARTCQFDNNYHLSLDLKIYVLQK